MSESRPGVDGNQDQRDREMSAGDTDERPWFQLMKRRRSVTEVVKQNNRNDIRDGSHGEDNVYRDEDISQRQHQGQSDYHGYHHGHQKNEGWTRASERTPVNLYTAKSYPGFRSGLQLLLESEK